MEPPKKGKGKAKAGGSGAGGGSSSKPKAAASSGEASTSQQGSGQRSTPPFASTAPQAPPPTTEPALHWTQIKIPPNPTSGTPQEMQAARKERQRVRRLYEAARLQAGE